MPQRLAGKTAPITGGGKGIGRQIAQRLAAEGARIVSIDTDDAGNSHTTSLIQASGGWCKPVRGDVSEASDAERAFRVAGTVDILVNNAALCSGDGRLHQVSEKDWERILAVSLKAVFLCSRKALPGMMERRTGSIINISSVDALTGINHAAYTTAKGGIVSLRRLLAHQYARYGLRVDTICPGTIMTPSSKRYYDEHPNERADFVGARSLRKLDVHQPLLQVGI